MDGTHPSPRASAPVRLARSEELAAMFNGGILGQLSDILPQDCDLDRTSEQLFLRRNGKELSFKVMIHEEEGLHSTLLHSHIIASNDDPDDGDFDFCCMGVGDAPEARLANLAESWLVAVAPVVISDWLGEAVGGAEAFGPSEGVVPGCSGFVGPIVYRFGEPDEEWPALPFGIAAALATPRPGHAAKAVWNWMGAEQSISTEVNGHEETYREPFKVAADAEPSEALVVSTVHAVFRFTPEQLTARRELDQSIGNLLASYLEDAETPLLERLESLAAKLDEGTRRDIQLLLPEVCTRALLPVVQYSPCLWHVSTSGDIEHHRIMEKPVFARGGAMLHQLLSVCGEEDGTSNLLQLAAYSASFSAISNAFQGGMKPEELSGVEMAPVILFDQGTPEATIQRATDLASQSIAGTSKKKSWLRRLFGR